MADLQVRRVARLSGQKYRLRFILLMTNENWFFSASLVKAVQRGQEPRRITP